jgi:HEPN domain-containing protein
MKTPQEWLRQGLYDMEKAEYNCQGGRYYFAVFLCHLAIEKAFKGLYEKMTNRVPPRTHNLMYLIEEMSFTVPDEIYDHAIILNDLAVFARYPDSLELIRKNFDEPFTCDLIIRGKAVLEWIEKKLAIP